MAEGGAGGTTGQRWRTARDPVGEGEWVTELCPSGTGKQQQGFMEVAVPYCS